MEERYSSTNSQVDPILTSRGSLRSTFIPIPNNNESARAMHWTKNSCRSQKQIVSTPFFPAHHARRQAFALPKISFQHLSYVS